MHMNVNQRGYNIYQYMIVWLPVRRCYLVSHPAGQVFGWLGTYTTHCVRYIVNTIKKASGSIVGSLQNWVTLQYIICTHKTQRIYVERERQRQRERVIGLF